MKKSITLFVFCGLTFFFAAPAFSFTIDGNLADWGVTPETHWAPNAGIYSTVEFQGNGGASGYLGPGYGGHPFDAEAMYATFDSHNLYFAIVTGFPAGGVSGYTPGDVDFDFKADGSYEYGVAATNHNGFIQGDIYSVDPSTGWNKGLSNWGGVSDPTSIKAGTLLNTTGNSLVYNNSTYGNLGFGHWVIEGDVPLSAFGSSWGEGKTVDIHWTETCGNDAIDLKFTPSPEPTSLVLLGLGFVGMVTSRKRRRAKGRV